ncbi:unnamed protein product [Hyaloperonospora brassicae]|uniref:Uncharacterized protein n=1 Tax=Hyaloperonospora brassicae TaxID=162125 RepID=A0AAV0SZY0_HYABA|nr:unnamed protein product [Hyaloperonospora brassicae]
MSCDFEPADLSKREEDEEEDEELMFAFEQQSEEALSTRSGRDNTEIFYSIDGVGIERPANPVAAILERRESVESTKVAGQEDEILKLEDNVDVLSVLHSRKRKTLEVPCTQVFHPIAKRLKSNAQERSVTATACLMDNLSLHRTSGRQCHRQQQEEVTLYSNENKTDTASEPPVRSATITIPERFQPIHWPGDATGTCSSEKSCNHSNLSSSSSSSCSSSKSRNSGLSHFCRLGLDVPSHMRAHLNDLVLHSSAGSYTGS